jgi:hypothetical protein
MTDENDWAAEREFVTARFDYWCDRLELRRGRPELQFGGDLLETWKRGYVEEVAPGMLYAAWQNVIVADLRWLFGTPGETDLSSEETARIVDGLLLHELGHRHDRYRIEPLLPASAIAFPPVFVGGLMVLTDGVQGVPSWGILGGLLLLGGIVLGLIVRGLLKQWVARLSYRRRMEDRADDYMADHGGLTVAQAMMSAFAGIPDGERADDPRRVYRPAVERLARLEKRLSERSAR